MSNFGKVATMTNPVDASLAYAARGLAVLPARARSKAPLTEHGVKDASTDEVTIRAWWTKCPDANVAIACGTVSGGLIVLDCDTAEFCWVLEKSCGPLPETYAVATGRGTHRYFISREPIRTQTLAPHLEIRGEGAYVLVPPSVHPSGARYRAINDCEPAPLPDALLELLRAPHTPSGDSPSVEGKILQGQRNTHLTSLAGSMRRRAMSAEAIEAALITENGRRCEPPLPESEVRRIAASVSRYEPTPDPARKRPAPVQTSYGPRAGVSDLVNEIRRIVLSKEIPLFDKRRDIGSRIEDDLRARGQFFRTNDGRGFYFHNAERRLYDVEQGPFERLVGEVSGLSSTENLFKFALDILQTKALRSSYAVEVHSFSSYDPKTHSLAVSDGGGGIWRRAAGSNWEEGKNGDDSIYFLTDTDATPWVPEFTNGGAREWWLNLFLFSNEGLSADDCRTLLHLWIEHQFFPPFRRTRLIPCFLGGQGSGKTTGMRLVGRLLVGPNFDVTGIQRDREDAFVAAVANRVVLALDNVDSKIPYLPDTLALYATGQRYRLRKLYTTNEEASYTPRAILLVSSRDPRFNRPDVTERLLPLYFSRPVAYVTEEQIFSELEKRRGEIMGSFLTHIAKVTDTLRITASKPLPFRMADFASFGERIFSAMGKSSEFLDLLDRLEKKQAEFAAEGDGIIFALQVLLGRSESLDEISVAELFKKCSAVAEECGLLIPRTAQGFGQRLSSMRRVIELELGVNFIEMRGHERRRFVSLKAR